MCGINGIIALKKLPINIVNEMNNSIIHRGPDDDGVYTNKSMNVSLGMRRLSIIDLESGKQPMISEDGNLIIIFNGEIYNYQDLKSNLVNFHNVIFNTKSDTEVILKGYEIYGISFFNSLNGMYSISIYNIKENKVIIVRDRVGEKPLYYWKDNYYFVFCSELKSLKYFFKKLNITYPEISKLSLNIFFNTTFIPAPYTIYENVYKLEPGHYLTIDTTTLDTIKNKYWDVINCFNSIKINNYKDAQIKLKNILYESVEKRMISDVPYGAFLSGGVDSSIITAIMADIKKNEKVKTFSIISNNKNFDESKKSFSVSKHLNTEHHPILLDLIQIEDQLDNVILNFDEPFADSSALASFYVSKITSNYVKVALTGDGADEVFGGYNRYLFKHYSSIYKNFIPSILHTNVIKPIFSSIVLNSDKRGNLFKLKKFLNAFDKNEFDNIKSLISIGFQDNELSNLLTKDFQNDNKENILKFLYENLKNQSYLTKARYLDLIISLEGDMLVKVDRTSMLNSLECRSPFLDHNIIEFSFALPDNFLVDGKNTKKILKDTFQNMLPKNLFNQAKSGFGIPIGDWLRKSLRNDLEFFINKDFIKSQGLFNSDYIISLVNKHLDCSEDNTFKVWSYYCFQKWWLNNKIF
jgi:asparagine synthase (glutamine-hydrolysing)